ncbi:hypothetical protein NPIL_207401 [Nephila pilipes]|uniref:Uncharacterized protein n=1 Tax=Nephila pilipes TaxID=299642 RepID=A0A8X6R3D0_NEPPI|nr:hypothetical protein NPIL_207401 [Nephila pilipes]
MQPLRSQMCSTEIVFKAALSPILKFLFNLIDPIGLPVQSGGRKGWFHEIRVSKPRPRTYRSILKQPDRESDANEINRRLKKTSPLLNRGEGRNISTFII